MSEQDEIGAGDDLRGGLFEQSILSGARENTDRELWRGTHEAGDYYADHVDVTEDGRIQICVGGFCVSRTPGEWVDLAWPPCPECGTRALHPAWCSLRNGNPDNDLRNLRLRLGVAQSLVLEAYEALGGGSMQAERIALQHIAESADEYTDLVAAAAGSDEIDEAWTVLIANLAAWKKP